MRVKSGVCLLSHFSRDLKSFNLLMTAFQAASQYIGEPLDSAANVTDLDVQLL